jgi:hypothetical protein
LLILVRSPTRLVTALVADGGEHGMPARAIVDVRLGSANLMIDETEFAILEINGVRRPLREKPTVKTCLASDADGAALRTSEQARRIAGG